MKQPGHGEPDLDDHEPPPLNIGDPKKNRIRWNTPPTAAEKRGAPDSIPRAMWERIADAMRADAASEFFSINDALAEIGKNFGVTKSELIACGIIAPPPAPNLTALKGARR
jgi:hypothetical protein